MDLIVVNRVVVPVPEAALAEERIHGTALVNHPEKPIPAVRHMLQEPGPDVRIGPADVADRPVWGHH